MARRAKSRPPAVQPDKQTLLASFQKGDLKRVFIGIVMDPAVMTAYSALRPPVGPGHWEWKNPSDYHVTLALPGFLNQNGIDYLCAKLDKLALRAFDGGLAGLGCFDDRPRTADYRDVLYARPEQRTAARLFGVRHNIAEALSKAGLPADSPGNKFGYTPHITLAKVKATERRALHDFMAASSPHVATPSWCWDHYGVYESLAHAQRPAAGGVRYALLEKKMLLSG